MSLRDANAAKKYEFDVVKNEGKKAREQPATE